MGQPKKFEEDWGEYNSAVYLGCVHCKQVHHMCSFCGKCGRCFYQGKRSRPGEGTLMDFDVVHCPCGNVSIWD